MTSALPCSLCGRYQNQLGEYDVCRHCEADIARVVQEWVPVLESLLGVLVAFDAYYATHRGVENGLPKPRRARDLPGWIVW